MSNYNEQLLHPDDRPHHHLSHHHLALPPSEIKLRQLLAEEERNAQIHAFGRVHSQHCCIRYWLSTPLLILLCCSFIAIGMGLIMARVTFTHNPYPGQWHRDICHAPSVQEDAQWAAAFFSPCSRNGFQCSICQIHGVTLTYLDRHQAQQTVELDLVAHDLTQDQCDAITQERRFNCVWQLDKNDKITIYSRDEYNLDHKGYLRQLRSAAWVLSFGLALLCGYMVICFYRLLKTRLEQRFPTLQRCSIKWLLYRCCCQRYMDRPQPSGLHSNPQPEQLWSDKIEVIMDERDPTHFELGDDDESD